MVLGTEQAASAQVAVGPQLLSILEQDSLGSEHSTPAAPPQRQVPL
jgi:hypothetical protein